MNIPNSMTILTDLLPVAIVMTQRRLKGVYNFTNPGAISHNEILELYKKVGPAMCLICACCNEVDFPARSTSTLSFGTSTSLKRSRTQS